MRDLLKKIGLIEIALSVCIIRLTLPMGPTLFDVGALFVVMLAYMHRRYEENKTIIIKDLIDSQEMRTQKQMEDIGAALMRLSDRIDLHDVRSDEMKGTQEKLARSADDIQKVISTQNLRSAIYTRVRNKETP